MSYSKEYWMERLLEMNNPYYQDSYDNNTDSYINSDNDVTEDYVDVVFDGFDRIYTYISPTGEKLAKGDKYLINGNDGPEPVEIVRGTYTDKVKSGLNYKVLPIINKVLAPLEIIDNTLDSFVVNGYIVEKYKKEKHLKYIKNTNVWCGGVNEKNIKKYYEENPKNTFVIFDELMGNKVYLGNFCIDNNDDFIDIAIALSNDIFPSNILKQECYDFLSKLIVVIRDFLLKNYPYDKSKYRISLEHAGPGEYEIEFLSIINSSKIMHVGAKIGMSCWIYYFD